METIPVEVWRLIIAWAVCVVLLGIYCVRQALNEKQLPKTRFPQDFEAHSRHLKPVQPVDDWPVEGYER